MSLGFSANKKCKRRNAKVSQTFFAKFCIFHENELSEKMRKRCFLKILRKIVARKKSATAIAATIKNCAKKLWNSLLRAQYKKLYFIISLQYFFRSFPLKIFAFVFLYEIFAFLISRKFRIFSRNRFRENEMQKIATFSTKNSFFFCKKC